MKKILFFLLITAIVKTAFSIDDTVTVSHQIKSATVYLKGAEVKNVARVNVTPGNVYLFFTNLPAALDPKSIQVKCDKEITLLSVVHQTNYLKPVNPKDEIVKLDTKLKDLDRQIAFNQTVMFVYKQEEELILNHKSLNTTSEGVNVEELKKAAEYYNTKLMEIRTKQLEINAKNAKLNDEKNQLNMQLAELNAYKEKPVSEIIVKIQSAVYKNTEVEISYMATEAGWTPKYDLRAKDVSSPIELTYKADVWQNTGFDWKNIKIKLSTTEPLKTGTKPELNTWYLPNTNYNNNTGASAKAVTTIFDIDNPYTIPSDKKKYTVEVNKNTIKSLYEYNCVPKIDEDAFLISKIIDWSNYYLLNGEVNLFFEGTFVGKSNLNVGTTEDTLRFSLGRDKNVLIQRKRITEFTEKQLVGNKKIETFGYEINVRNNKRENIQLVIEDQVPVSTHKEIEVIFENNSGAVYDDKTGKLKWTLNLAPSENKKLQFKFSIKYPKDTNFSY